MKRNKFIYIFLIIIMLILVNIPFKDIYNFENGAIVTYEDVKSSNKNNLFGEFVKTELNENKLSVGSTKNNDGVLTFKLFGIFPIRRVKVNMLNNEEVYVGGVPIGLVLNSDGAIVVRENQSIDIKNKDNTACEKLKPGDIITEINDVKVKSLDDIPKMLNDIGKEVEVKYLRDNKERKVLIKLLKDDEGNKLGIYVKDDISGVGTLTYVNKKSLKFGALGHGITDNKGNNIVPIANGKIYNCNIIGINKGQRNKPGELRCLFVQNKNSKGLIDDNNKFGIYGKVIDTEGIIDENLTVKIGGRLGVKTGKAYIVSSISGIREEYEIEIIKANYQKKASDKSLVFRVKDDRLLNLTGGIVQGMSGSPIIQDGKMIGAVTHVFLSDPTKGFGVYCDWMM